jgi:hypothetical protein
VRRLLLTPAAPSRARAVLGYRALFTPEKEVEQEATMAANRNQTINWVDDTDSLLEMVKPEVSAPRRTQPASPSGH